MSFFHLPILTVMASSRPAAAATGSSRDASAGGTGHAVDRSPELLACARSALQMGQDRVRRRRQQQEAENGHAHAAVSESGDGPLDLPEELLSVSPATLRLYSSAPSATDDIYAATNPNLPDDDDAPLTTDALRLLSALDASTSTLSSLVRRRGHTNDPTARINDTVHQFEEMAQELGRLVEQIKSEGTVPIECPRANRRRMSQQRARHYEHVARDLSAMADGRVGRFKKMLEVRERVIREQNERRRLLHPKQGAEPTATRAAAAASSSSSAPNSGSIAATIAARSTLMAGARGGASQLSSPLFTVQGGAGAGAAGHVQHAGAGIGAGAAVRPPPPPPRPVAAAAAAGAYSTTSASAANRLPAAPAAALHPSSAPPSTTSAGTGAYGTSSSNGTTYGGYGGSGYGRGNGSGAGYEGMGMRQRRPNAPGMSAAGNGYAGYGGYGGQAYQQYAQQQQQPYDPAHGDDSKKTDGDYDDAAAVQNSIQTRRARRETAARLEQARGAERTLANLGTMFGKMADLVVAQGETIEKVEDDVEAAHVDVYAGHEEIQKLYGITKGNRGLILKVFSILIFFIIFMRFY